MEQRDIFGRRLKQLRQERGWSIDKLCEEIDNAVSKQTISKYERGLMMAGDALIEKLAHRFGVSTEYFFTPYSFDLQNIEVSFRKKSKLGKKEEQRIKSEIQAKLERTFAIDKILGINSQVSKIECPETVSKPEQMIMLARKVREKWNLGIAPIVNVANLLIRNGIRVFTIDAPETFDGISGKLDAETYIIVINRSFESTERKRFTLLHELAHLIANESFDKGLSEYEKETLCHRFASEMLLPKSLYGTLFYNSRQFFLSELEKVQIEYGISIDAMMVSFFKNGFISDKRYRNFCFRRYTDFQLRKSRETSLFVETDKYDDDEEFKKKVKTAYEKELISKSRAEELLGESLQTHYNNVSL